MVTKVVFLLALFGLSWSRLPVRRRCDPEERRDTPTLCSNYRNIVHLDEIQTELVENQEQLQRRMDAVDMQVHSANISRLQRLVTNLSSALSNAEIMKTQTEMQLRDTKTQLERQEADIASLKRLVQHGDRLNEIEQRVRRTETETEAAFNDTQRILHLYNSVLSDLNSTAKVQARLVAMETRLQTEVQKIQNNSEEIKHRLKSTEDEVAEQSELRLEVNGLPAEVDTKVAFSAARIESDDVLTGRILIFNRVVTNIGNAYSRKTGVFTAPLDGVYHFTFTTSGDSSFTPGGVLVKNGRYRIRTWERSGPDISDTNSSTVILHLNARDRVNIVLWDGGRIRTSVFSGFLVFTTS